MLFTSEPSSLLNSGSAAGDLLVSDNAASFPLEVVCLNAPLEESRLLILESASSAPWESGLGLGFPLESVTGGV